jgi:hypothetical protein
MDTVMPDWVRAFRAVCTRGMGAALDWGLPEQWVHAELFAELRRDGGPASTGASGAPQEGHVRPEGGPSMSDSLPQLAHRVFMGLSPAPWSDTTRTGGFRHGRHISRAARCCGPSAPPAGGHGLGQAHYSYRNVG